jgi:hypothetical protein
MNYYAMDNAQLGELLKKRRLLTPHLGNELFKIYGVAYIIDREKQAENEAIQILEADDRRRLTIPKVLKTVGWVVALILSLAGLFQLAVSIWHHFIPR